MNKVRFFVEDVILWVVLAVVCVTLTVDYICGTRITEWLV